MPASPAVPSAAPPALAPLTELTYTNLCLWTTRTRLRQVAVTHSNIGTDADAYDEVSAAGAGPAPVYHTQPADEQGCRMAATLGGIVTSPTALSLTEHQHGYDVIPDVKNSSPAGDSDEIYTEIDGSKEDAPVYDVIRLPSPKNRPSTVLTDTRGRTVN